MNIVEQIGKDLVAENRPLNFHVGDTVRVHYKIVEGNRERIQVYEGVVIAIDNKAVGKTFTVRRISYDVGVERIFPLFSPRIAKIEIMRKSKVRRSKLYFLRERTGKATKLREKIISKAELEAQNKLAEDAAEAAAKLRAEAAAKAAAPEENAE